MTLHIASLTVYPVKGLGGIDVSEAHVGARGLDGDRRWMVVDAATRDFVSQRTHPIMACLQTTLASGVLAISRKAGVGGTGRPQGGDPDGISVPAIPDDGEAVPVTVWGDEVRAIAPSPEADAWFSDVLETVVRLVYQPDSARRDTDPRRAPGHEVSFADGYPLLVISQASLDALNRRTPEPIPMDRFRPNVVVGTTAGGTLPPHDEDLWQRFRLGDVPCAGVKCAARCSVTTVDQATGIREKEPLRTLATYRSWDGKVWFGQNVVPMGEGTLRVGDRVQIDQHGPIGPCPPLPEPPEASQRKGE